MSRITYYPQQYKCGSCQKVQSHYVWSNEIEETKHTCTCGCEVNVCDIFEPTIAEAPQVRTPTSNSRIQASRKKRNLDHWKKNDYPNLAKGSDEQKHFAKKHKLKT